MVPRFGILRPLAIFRVLEYGRCIMAGWTPSINPGGDSEAVYLVADDFGDLGRCCRETDFEAAADLETIITDLLNAQYNNPVRVVGFNTSEGWSRDVSE